MTRLVPRTMTVATCVSLLSVQAGPSGAAFPGRNGKIAHESTRPGDADIFVVRPNGTGRSNLTRNDAQDFEPVFSPDGSRIAFGSDRDGDFEVWLMNADGSGLTQVTHNEVTEDFPNGWSPDGSRILIASDRTGDFEAYWINPETGARRRLTFSASFDAFGAWSPDGSQVAFVSDRTGSFDVFVKPASGGRARNLTRTPDAHEFYVDWSPDGSRLAFESTRDQWRGEIYLMDPDGSNVTRLTFNRRKDGVPVWSPNGRKIAFACHFRTWDICVLNAVRGGVSRLSSGPGDEFFPDWQPRR